LVARRVVVVYKSDNGDIGKALVELQKQLKGCDIAAFIPREKLVEKDTRNAVVIIAGGDGTLLGASHRILDDYSQVLGVRLKGESVGYYTAVDVENLARAMVELESSEEEEYEVHRLPRLECIMHTDTGNWVRTDLALNEFFIANTCAYMPSKYTLLYQYPDGTRSGEYQRSSGVLVCTHHGYSGWVQWARGGGKERAQYDFNSNVEIQNNSLCNVMNGKKRKYRPAQLPDVLRPETVLDKDQFFFHVREPIGAITLDDQRLGPTQKLLLQSDMHRGFVVPDSFDEYHFNRGAEIEIRMSPKPLNIIHFDNKGKWRKD